MAIQVNGTTVINNSRQLTNIASVDSTTKSAIESAGVGGKTTLLTDTTISSGTSSVSVSFTGGYEVYRIYLKDVFYSPNNAGNKFLMARFTNSSGSNITSSYSGYYRKYSDSTGGITNGNEAQMYMSDLSFPININCSLYMDVYNPYDTSERTMCNWQFITGLNDLGYDQAWIGHSRRNQQIERNNSIYFYWEYPSYGTGNFGGGRITVYGVSL